MDVLKPTTSTGDPESLASEARRELVSSLARLHQLHERARAASASTAREYAELQRFLQEFAPDIPGFGAADGIGLHFDVGAMRAAADELHAELTRSQALETNLGVTVGLVQSALDQLDAERVFTRVQETADLRLQQAMNAAREEERRRLAREIHDGPAQVLSNAVFAVDTTEQIAKREPTQVVEELAQLRKLLKDGVAEIRRFMFDLRPTMLQDFGLAPTLQRYVTDHGRFFGGKVEFTCDDPLPSLTADQELQIFRIVQEGLQNVHKHAGPGAEAHVSIRRFGPSLVLEIEDNGRGFDPSVKVPRPDGGGGLPGMRERAKLVGAELTVTSEIGKGTIVKLVMPLRGQTGYLRS